MFRYALERWPPDPYQAVVLHRGGLSPSEQTLADELTAAPERSKLNVETQVIDLDTATEERWTRLWELTGNPALPCVVLLYPQGTPATGPAWVGPLTSDKMGPILRSPVREELFERLVAGQSGVWVLLEIGDPSRDDAAAAYLEGRLKHLATSLKLPELNAEDLESGFLSIPEDQLKVSFSLMRVARTNAAEEILVSMLLGSEGDLGELSEPMAFPVFGRGRALYALIGAGINDETVDEAGKFLTGACSCQVKELNPGVDLLMAGDWEGRVKGSYIPERDPPPLAGLGGFGQSLGDEPTAGTPPTGVADGKPGADRSVPVAPSGIGSGLKNAMVLVGAAGLLAVGAFTVILLRRKA